MGAFETEVALWLNNLKQWIYRHERFTWINFALSIVPSPVAALLAIILACLQLCLCIKGRIPKSEKNILTVSLILAIINLALSSLLVYFLAKKGWSLWHTFNPFLWLVPLKQKLFNDDFIYVLNLIC